MTPEDAVFSEKHIKIIMSVVSKYWRYCEGKYPFEKDDLFSAAVARLQEHREKILKHAKI